MKENIKNAQIHIRVSDEIKSQWLDICDTMQGNTQSQVFRKLIEKLHSSIEETINIKNYEPNN